MNSTPQPTEDTRTVPSNSRAPSAQPLDPTARRSAIRALRTERLVRLLARSPFFEPFCTLLRPAIHWLMGPTNAAVAALILIVSPFIALLLMPLFIILAPVGLGIGALAMIANSMKMGAEEHQEILLSAPAKS